MNVPKHRERLGKDADKRHRALIVFSKGEEARWIGHLDVVRVFERAVRRACLPVSYTEGFNPRPRMSFASALGVGATGARELMSLELSEQVDPKEIGRSLGHALPHGIKIEEVQMLPWGAAKDFGVRASEFEVTVEGVGLATLRGAVERLLSRSQVVVERARDGRVRKIDIRLGLVYARVVDSDPPIIEMCLRHGETTPKPAEVVEALAKDVSELRCLRVHRRRLQVDPTWDRKVVS